MKLGNVVSRLAISSVFVTSAAQAAVTIEEAAQLGSTLTRFGAISAGNENGSIPAYAAGKITPPATYKPGMTGGLPNPFADEKPLFTITAANMGEYLDKLDEGTQTLLKRWPDSYKLNVYPTHRTAPYPEWVLENTVKNATLAKLVNAQGDGVEGAYGGIPFPIPQNGLEVLWNHFLYWQPVAQEGRSPGYLVDAAGGITDVGVNNVYYEVQYYNPDKDELDGPYYKLKSAAISPASKAGQQNLSHYSINYAEREQNTWNYSTGQRRVRLTPDFKYDTPAAPYGGMMFYDEIFLFSGRPDRFDWELVGKKEMYIPYNAYEQVASTPQQLLGKQHLNPERQRWELHRVWEVKATLKQGARHAAQSRTFFFDEDSWKLVLSAGYDQGGELYRVGQAGCYQVYDSEPPYMSCPFTMYDLTKGQYTITPVYGGKSGFLRAANLRSPYETTPGGMQGSGIR